MNYPIGKKVIIRTNRAGVFYGTLSEYDAVTRIAEIKDCRRLWYWSGAASLSQLANEGVKNPSSCNFTVVVPVMQVKQSNIISTTSRQSITAKQHGQS